MRYKLLVPKVEMDSQSYYSVVVLGVVGSVDDDNAADVVAVVAEGADVAAYLLLS